MSGVWQACVLCSPGTVVAWPSRDEATVRCPTLTDLPDPPRARIGWPWTEESDRLPDSMPDGRLWPRVSIVTSSYNQGRFIEETIRSVLLQGYPNLEYIIMDGGSTDNSLEIIKKYEPWLSYWVSEPDRGQSDAINEGFGKSTGEVMAWLNSDDIYVRGTIPFITDYFRSDPQYELLYGEAWYIDENSYRVEPCRNIRRQFEKRYMLNRDPIVQPTAFWRRSLWVNVGQLDLGLTWGFDWDFFIRAYLNTEPHYIPQFFANYRLHGHMKTKSGGEDRHAELAKISRR